MQEALGPKIGMPECQLPDLLRQEHIGYFAVKRAMDLLGALILLLLLAPLMLLIAAAIWIYSPGPVLFIQERIGARREGRGGHRQWKQVRFRCYKFRTMHVNADSSIHQLYVKALIENNDAQMVSIQGEQTQTRKLLHDSRIIRPGQLLRKLSLDELPQLWNVVRGDMSLVGPRPAIPYEVDIYKPWHLDRLNAQAGITGLQQVTARSTASFDEQVRLDLEYISKRSLIMDIGIMLRTPFAILSTKGAH